MLKKIVIILVVLLFANMTYAKVFEWDPPSTNTDGTTLDDLGGYKIHCGTASGVYTIIINILNTCCSYNPGNQLTEGVVYYCVMTAYDTIGNESPNSNEVSTTYSLTNFTSNINFMLRKIHKNVSGSFGGGFK